MLESVAAVERGGSFVFGLGFKTVAARGDAFLDKFKKYGKPIWLTEFCNWANNNISADAQMKYMVEAERFLYMQHILILVFLQNITRMVT